MWDFSDGRSGGPVQLMGNGLELKGRVLEIRVWVGVCRD